MEGLQNVELVRPPKVRIEVHANFDTTNDDIGLDEMTK
jgi:hypothetical protein